MDQSVWSQKLVKSQKSSKSKSEKSKKLSKNENSSNFDALEAGPSFLTPKARATFNCLQLAFTKAPILWHFDPKCHIWIEIDILGYTIGHMLSQLAFGTRPDRVAIKTDLDQWHLVVFFFRKMIPVETQYKTHHNKLLAIVEAF